MVKKFMTGEYAKEIPKRVRDDALVEVVTEFERVIS